MPAASGMLYTVFELFSKALELGFKNSDCGSIPESGEAEMLGGLSPRRFFVPEIIIG